ncbi:MAG: redoxin domain-containing protein [Myxococcota bacterium]
MKRVLIAVAALALIGACAKSDNGNVQTPTTSPAQPEAAAAAQPASAVQPTDGSLGAAPDFTLKDLNGNDVSLAKFKGKTVVLEWFNPGCPFVKYAYDKGPLKDMAARVAGDANGNVVWLAINSGGPGKQGHGLDMNKQAAAQWEIAHPILIDESGTVGKAYGAEKTPHIFIVDPAGQLVYRGALDNAPIGEVRDEGGTFINYVEGALNALAAGSPVSPAETKAYGCSVKYGS